MVGNAEVAEKTGRRGHPEPGHVYFLGEEFLVSLPLEHKYLCRVSAYGCQPCLIEDIKYSSFAGTPCNICRRCCREWRGTRDSIQAPSTAGCAALKRELIPNLAQKFSGTFRCLMVTRGSRSPTKARIPRGFGGCTIPAFGNSSAKEISTLCFATQVISAPLSGSPIWPANFPVPLFSLGRTRPL
jgi:hypothetical protein